MERGKYIVLDGADGTGKSTQVPIVADFLSARGISVEKVWEPGYTALGVELRKMMLDGEEQLDPTTELLLMNADRAQTALATQSFLDNGTWVVSDRSWLSTIVYQCMALGADHQLPIQICLYAMGGLRADLTMILNVDARTANERRGIRGATDNIEARGSDYHQRVRDGFLRIATEMGFPIIDGAGSLEMVTERLIVPIKRLLEV